MDEHGYSKAVPEREADVEEQPFLDFQAGYVLRALDRFPKQGSRAPWRLRQNYALDIKTLRHAPIEDGAMAFSNPEREEAAKSAEQVAA